MKDELNRTCEVCGRPYHGTLCVNPPLDELNKADGGANEVLGLPRAKMVKVVIAIDVDGTLRSNKTETSEESNQRIVDLANTLSTFKNVKVMVWSGGGKEYADRFRMKYGLHGCFPASKIDPSTWKYGRPQIAIDDIQDTAIADINLIVWEK